MTDLTLRTGTAADTPALVDLAALDSAAPLAAPVLVAQSSGRLVAAVSLVDGRAVADPLRPTAAAVELLRLRARQARRAAAA